MKKLVAIIVLFGSLNWSGTQGQQQDYVPKGCCVAMALDESTSLTDPDFEIEKKFAADIIANFPNFHQPNGQYAGVCIYSTSVLDVFSIATPQTKEQAIAKISSLLLEGGLTSTHLAIDALVKYQEECPDGYNQAGLVITDGNADSPELTRRAAKRFRDAGHLLIVVGVGEMKEDELKAIASPGYYCGVANFTSLTKLLKQIQTNLCSEWITTTPLTTTKMTPAPTTIPSPPPPALAQPDCLECEFINGLYIFRNKNYCYVYNQCLSWTQAIPLEQPCPFNQFFEPWAATCMVSSHVDCPNDPCKDGKVKSYPNHRVCSAYYTCSNSRTVAEMCCASGQRFIRGSGCLPDATCRDPCKEVPRQLLCMSRPHPSDETKYQDNTGSNIWITRNCASGTKFDKITCKCALFSRSEPDSTPICEHELYLPFEVDLQDYMYRKFVTNSKPNVTKVTIQAVPGATGSKAAVFSGNNGLLVKSYDNAWFGQTLVIRTRFRETGTLSPPRKEAIFGNGDCSDKDGSVGMFYYRATNRVEAVVVTWKQDMSEVITRVSVIPVNSGDWKSCEYRYDGSTLRLTCGVNVASTPASGNIATRHAALQIGMCCEDEDNLLGYQDEFYVYRCLP